MQLWVWLHQRARVLSSKNEEGSPLDIELLTSIIVKESSKISTHDKLTLLQAKGLLKNLLKQEQLSESFLELAYPLLDRHQAKL